jgi:glycosyltransferase involved in cell wall biosynthesis
MMDSRRRPPLRILFAADVPPDMNSGAAGTELQTIRGLRRLGHEVDEIWAGDMPRRVKHGNLHYLLELPRAYRDAIRRKWAARAYDVVHVNQGHAYLAAQDHLRLNRPGVFVCRSHGLDDHMERVLKPWRERLHIQNRSLLKSAPGKLIDRLLDRHVSLAAKYASGFIVSSSLDRDFLIAEHGLCPERAACIHQAPADIFAASPVQSFSPARLKNILYVAGYGYVKGPHTVAAVANDLLVKHPDANFTWVCGESNHQDVTRLLSPEARARTRLVGWGSQEALLKLYDCSGIFIYPPLFDGFGKVFLEAMTRGLCVITTRTGGMRDIIRHGENGFHVDFDDAASIVRSIQYLWANHSKAEEVGRSAHEGARLHSWDRVAMETAGFYYKLLSFSERRSAGGVGRYRATRLL